MASNNQRNCQQSPQNVVLIRVNFSSNLQTKYQAIMPLGHNNKNNKSQSQSR